MHRTSSWPAGLGGGLSGFLGDLVQPLRPDYTCSQRWKRNAKGFLAFQFGLEKWINAKFVDFFSILISNPVLRNNRNCTQYKRSELPPSLAGRDNALFTKSHLISMQVVDSTPGK